MKQFPIKYHIKQNKFSPTLQTCWILSGCFGRKPFFFPKVYMCENSFCLIVHLTVCHRRVTGKRKIFVLCGAPASSVNQPSRYKLATLAHSRQTDYVTSDFKDDSPGRKSDFDFLVMVNWKLSRVANNRTRNSVFIPACSVIALHVRWIAHSVWWRVSSCRTWK